MYHSNRSNQLPERAAAFPAMKVSSVPLGYRSGEIIPFRIVLDTRAPIEIEPHRMKTGVLHMRKQRRRSASR